jgi:chemotaxis signal transduction protein
MLYVTYWAGNDIFAIAAPEIELVLPYASLKVTPRLHPAFAGTLNFHSEPVPVLDASVLLGAAPVQEMLNTRILLCPGTEATQWRRYGLAAERVTAELRLNEDEFVPAAAGNPGMAFAGRLARWHGRLIQRITPSQVITPSVREQLWTA